MSSVIVCPVCGGVDFTDKGRSGKLLMACRDCGTNVLVENGGIAQVELPPEEIAKAKEDYIYATEKPKKAKDDAFVSLTLRVPRGVNLLVRATLLLAKHVRGAHGNWFAGAVIGDIFTDYLSSVDWSEIPYATQAEVSTLLREAAELINTNVPKVTSRDSVYGSMVAGTGAKVTELVGDQDD